MQFLNQEMSKSLHTRKPRVDAFLLDYYTNSNENKVGPFPTTAACNTNAKI